MDADAPPPTAAAHQNGEMRQRMGRIDELIKEIERFRDPHARARTREIVAALMDFHGAALGRLLEKIAESSETGASAIEAAARDELVSNLLMLYGLHPVDLETRVRRGIDKARNHLKSHGGDVEILAIDDGLVRLRLHGSCHGCPSSSQTLRQTIEEAVFEIAPDVAGIEVVDELVILPEAPRPGTFALPILAGR